MKLFYLTCIFIASTSINAFDFRKIDHSIYFPNSTIRSFAKDQSGYLWLATDTNIWRFDGVTYKSIKDIINVSNDFRFQKIKKIYFDKHSVLWIATAEDGLYQIYDNQLKKYQHDSKLIDSISSNLVTAIAGDDTGIWIGTNNGLNYLSESGGFSHYKLKEPNKINDLYVSVIVNLDKDVLLIGTKTGLQEFNKQTKTLTKIVLNKNKEDFIVFSIIIDANKTIWVATQDGLYTKESGKKDFSKYRPEIFNQTIISVIVDKKNIWVGTFRNGLYKISIASDEISNYKYNSNNKNSLSANNITSMYKGDDEMLWINTFNGGINLVNTRSLDLGLHRNSEDDIFCSNSEYYTSFSVDINNNLWIASLNGLIKYDDIKKTCINYGVDYQNNSIQKNNLNYISMGSNNQLWMSTTRGLNIFDIDNKTIDVSHQKSTNIGLLFTKELNKDILLLGTVAGLYEYNHKLRKMSQIISSNESLNNSLIYNYTVSKTKLHFATSSGVAYLDKDNNFEYDPKVQPQLPTKNIFSVFVDAENNLWVGTSLYGLLKFNADGLLQKYFNDENGLSRYLSINRILNEGKNLWFGTNNGLIKLDIQTDKAYVFNSSDGLQGDFFNINAAYKSSTGKMYFGGRDGINVFYPTETKLKTAVQKIRLTEFLYFGKNLIPKVEENGFKLEKPIDELSQLNLSHNDYIIGFKFANLNFFDSFKTKYAYKLEGFDLDWNYVDAYNRQASYTNLPTGKYVFRVKSSNRVGMWNERETPLKIIVSPALWLRWWAFVIYSILFLCIIISYIKIKTRTDKRKAKMLQIEVDKQTIELTQEKQKVDSLLRKKNQFFENISHEFRTPLTLIIGPLNKLIYSVMPVKYTDSLKLINKNANRLLTMIEQLLHMAKVDEVKDSQQITQQTKPIVATIFNSFKTLALQKSITFELLLNDQAKVTTTQNAIEIIISNLVSNAIKYTAINGHISINSTVINGFLNISISDTGPGLDKLQQKEIFTRFKRLEIHENIEGVGLGLAVVREVAAANDVKITIDSVVGTGSQFTAVIKTVDKEVNKFNDPNVLLVKQLAGENLLSSPQKGYPITKTKHKHKQTLLVIEDNIDMANYIIDILKQHYHCLHAKDGKQGVSIATKQIPNIIICDVVMPIMDGFQVSHLIRNSTLTSHIPIVLLTALNDRKSKIKGWQEHIDLYLTKPFDEKELLMQISNILVIRKILQEKAGKAIKSLDSSIDFGLPKVEQDFLQKLFAIIKKNYKNPNFLRLQMADKMAVSERQLQRKTKEVIDKNPMDILRNYRLEQATYLLKDGYRVNIVAEKCGFNSITYFSSRFKSQYGVTPSDYKKTCYGRS